MNTLPEKIEAWFSLRRLTKFGRNVLWSIALAVLATTALTLWFYIRPVEYPNEQHVSVDANEIKRNSKYFHHYLNQIKEHNGLLLLGTSESGDLNQGNYYHYLNSDSNIDRKFSALGGAGRKMDVYIPLILASPEAWRGLDVVLFINPTYWRKGLNEPSTTYQKRYLDEGLIMSVSSDLKAMKAFKFYERIYGDRRFVHGFFHALGYQIDRLRSVWYSDFQISLNIKDLPFRQNAYKMDRPEIDLKAYLTGQDTSRNITYEFASKVKKLWFPAIDTVSSYQDELLSIFCQVCKKNDINLTIIIGPYNGILPQALGTKNLVSGYENVYQGIKDTLEKHNIKTIDLWDLSYNNRIFKDYQHHGQYGAFVMYNRIKSNIHENR